MTKFRKELGQKFPNVVGLPCSLHVFNLMVKDMIADSHAKQILKDNQALVNYFTVAGVWKESLRTWCQKNEVTYWLTDYVETRWYSVV
jgi:hypothetical protein